MGPSTVQSDLPAFGKPGINHFRVPLERPFLSEERETTTVLVGGLSPTHDFLFEATMKGLGVKAKALPPTNLESFHMGREYGNNGYCNPAYFTVGNLIRYLKDLEKSGISKADIIEHYVFFTAGCNAPCRFGLMEAEYRMVLKDSGFEGFRVLVFQNEGGLNQKVKGNGVEVNPEFFLATVNALNLADLVNELAFATRPYEKVEGKTDEVLEKAKDYLYEKLKSKKKIRVREPWNRLFEKLQLNDIPTFILRFWEQVTSSYYVDALRHVRAMFEAIEVDRFRSKAIVKITGEFWAITTAGAGNFHMFRFLESEGAVVLGEPVASLIQFLFSKAIVRHANRRAVLLKENAPNWWHVRQRLGNALRYHKKRIILSLGNKIFRREYGRLLRAVGGGQHMLIPQSTLRQLARQFFNPNIEGGESYMEVAKNIYYHQHELCHMVLGLKPFGCMPSIQSDGVQAAVTERNKEMIYLPIETAGEGETNAQSRVLMSLGDAQVKAKKEYAEAREKVSSNMDALRAYVERHPALTSPLYVIPRRKGVVNMAANFIYHVDELIRRE